MLWLPCCTHLRRLERDRELADVHICPQSGPLYCAHLHDCLRCVSLARVLLVVMVGLVWLPLALMTLQESLEPLQTASALCWFCRASILKRCLKRLEYEKAADLEAKQKAEQAEAERVAMQQIDW